MASNLLSQGVHRALVILCVFGAFSFPSAALPSDRLEPRPSPPCSNCVSYENYTLSAYVPFAPDLINPDTPPMVWAPELTVNVFHKNLRVIMDTGSIGFVISRTTIPLDYFDPAQADRYDLGWEFLSSSKRLWVGRWVPASITFTGGTLGVTSYVKVLAVMEEIMCPGYDITQDGGECPPAARPLAQNFTFGSDPSSANGWLNGKNASDVPNEVRLDPEGVQYLGVGIGRSWAGFPQGYPDRNVWLNVESIGDTLVTYNNDSGTVPAGTPLMRRGFIVNATGVVVGLTKANSGGTALQSLGIQSLDPVVNAPGWNGRVVGGMTSNWAEPRGCISINSSACQEADILTDTGVPQAYVYTGLELQTVNLTDASTGLPVPALGNGTSVEVSLDGIGAYTYVVGDNGLTTPSESLVDPHHVRGNNINTSRAFFRRFGVLLDAQGGYWGAIDKEGLIGKFSGKKKLRQRVQRPRVSNERGDGVEAGQVSAVCGNRD